MRAKDFCEGHFGATWSILRAILAPAGFWRGPQIDHFRRNQHNEKMATRSAARKNMRLWQKVDAKRRYTCCNLRGWAGSRNFMQHGAPKRIPNRSQSMPLVISGVFLFWDFYRFWQDCFFDVLSFGRTAGQNHKKSTFGRLDGPANMILDAIWNPTWVVVLADSGSLYILLFDKAWHRPVSADFGTHWISKGYPNPCFQRKSTSKGF